MLRGYRNLLPCYLWGMGVRMLAHLLNKIPWSDPQMCTLEYSPHFVHEITSYIVHDGERPFEEETHHVYALHKLLTDDMN